jgi:hypothetical protein
MTALGGWAEMGLWGRRYPKARSGPVGCCGRAVAPTPKRQAVQGPDEPREQRAAAGETPVRETDSRNSPGRQPKTGHYPNGAGIPFAQLLR